jgi:hypothetical protein
LCLESDLEALCDFVSSHFGAAFDFSAAARLAVILVPLLTISPTGLPVAIATTAGAAPPGVLLPPASIVPEPTLRSGFQDGLTILILKGARGR